MAEHESAFAAAVAAIRPLLLGGTIRDAERVVLAVLRAASGAGDDAPGWTAAENAEFEQRYGIQAAMRLQAANDRVWQIVAEIRQQAVKEGRDPYQDPMAQRLSAALVGAGGTEAARVPSTMETAE